MDDFTRTVEQLCRASRRAFVDPYQYLEWPEALEPSAQWYFSPELASLYGTPAWDAMTGEQRRVLSFYEAVNFFSLNIHGEKPLVEGLAQRLFKTGFADTTPYIHHFLDEENKHMVYFGGFCTRYAGKVDRDRKLAFPRDYAPGEEDFLFFAKVLVFEEIVDVYNMRMARDDRLPEIVRRINLVHHLEESRHLAFGRLLVRRLFQHYAPGWPSATLEGARQYLHDYIASTWREYYNPDAYADAGVGDPRQAQQAAMAHPAQQRHRAEVTAKCARYLREAGILEEVTV